MSITDDLVGLVHRLQQLLALLAEVEQAGDLQSRPFAEGVRRRLDALRAIDPDLDRAQLALRLLDLVPTAKDAEAIGFILADHPAAAALRDHIEAAGAKLAGPLIQAL